ERADAEEVSHMLFGDGTGLSGLFATHPPVLQRIQALEPSFRAESLERLKSQWLAMPPSGLDEDVQMGLVGPGHGVLPQASSRIDVTPPMVSSQVADPRDDDYRRADTIVATMPGDLRAIAGRRDGAGMLLLGLLLDGEAEVADRQRSEIVARLGVQAAAEARRLRDEYLHALHPMLRMPLASLAFPAMRLLPRPELATFLDTVHALVHADGRVSLFEYCLGRLLEVQLRETLDPGRYASFGRRKPGNVRQEFATLLAVVAHAGSPQDADAARRAYLAGMQRVLPRDHLPYAPPAEGVLALDAVWEPLDALDPLAKQVAVEAITDAISHDGKVTVAEAELLRTICGVFHCPPPPRPNCCARSAACSTARCRRCSSTPERRWRGPPSTARPGDQVGRALGDHDHRRVGIAARQGRHHRRIHHPQPLDPAHAQLRIDHRQFVAAHAAGAGRVVHAFGLGADEGGQACVVEVFAVREQRRAAPGGEGGPGQDVAGEARALDHHPQVEALRVGQVP